jgi:aminoglycoside phosphotransferase (APT) family kinase protein
MTAHMTAPVESDPPAADAADGIAVRVLGRAPRSVRRFGVGTGHYVFDLEFDGEASVVTRFGCAAVRAEMAGGVRLSCLLRPLGVPLPALIAHDLDTALPWMLLERLPGTDLGAVATSLSERQLSDVAAEIVTAQAIVAGTGSADRYGYAASAEDAPELTWSAVPAANLARSRKRIAAAGLFDVGMVDAVEDRLDALRSQLDEIEPTPFLHDTTTKNVIVAPTGQFSGIVDVDDLCFGDPRYPAALTLAAMMAYGGPTFYVSAWLNRAGLADDRLFRLYVAVFLLDLMSEHGHASNGNVSASTAESRAALGRAFAAALAYI